MSEIVKRYIKEDVTVVWKPDVCIHSTVCFKGLPRVFNPNKKPWVNMDGSDLEKIKAQVRNCPSGALSLEAGKEEHTTNSADALVEVLQQPRHDVADVIGAEVLVAHKPSGEAHIANIVS